MNYIGSKQKLAPWIKEVVEEVYVGKLEDAIFADIFAGTGQVARHFKKHVKKVITNDLESYSFILNSHYIGNTKRIESVEIANQSKVGVISKQFSEVGDMKRKYFTKENAQLIDGLRDSIEKLLVDKKINKNQYYWLMASLIESADSVANTASIYGAYLKEYKKTALKPLNFKLVPYEITEQKNEIYQMDANQLIKKISGDILYLDPPYNARQYGANYHVLNKIIENKDFKSEKITGLTDYNKSDYCKKDKVFETFESLIRDAKPSADFDRHGENRKFIVAEMKKKNLNLC